MSVIFPIVASETGTPLRKPGFPGPYGTTSAIRYLLTQGVDGGSNPVLSMLKSTDTGATWTEVDAAGAPLVFVAISSSDQSAVMCSCLDQDGIKIQVVYLDVSERLTIVPFSTATDTWGTPTTGPTPANTYTPFGGIHMACVLDANNAIVVVGNFGLNASSHTKSQYVLVTGGTSWGSLTNFSLPPEITDPNDLLDYSPCAVVVAGSFTHVAFCFSSGNIPVLASGMYHQSLASGGGLGALTRIGNSTVVIGEGGFFVPTALAFDSGNVTITTIDVGGDAALNLLVSAQPNAAALAFTLAPVDVGATETDTLEDLDMSVVSAGNLYTFFTLHNLDDDSRTYNYMINSDPPVLIGGFTPGFAFSLTFHSAVTPNEGWAISFTGSQDYWEQAGVVPPTPAVVPKTVGGGGTYFPRALNKSLLVASLARVYGQDWVTPRDYPPLSPYFLYPNEFDICLTREMVLYESIDREQCSCAKKPDCFGTNPRDWLESPPGWTTFNPVKAIALPAPATPETVILSFRVPYGYDGVILAQFHGYTENFTQGSGDIAWRVRADGRYLRDCGNMTLSLGNPKNLSPVHGGLQLRSGNLVEYVVAAPNGSGLLPPPGTGFVLAGLHGFFYPRI